MVNRRTRNVRNKMKNILIVFLLAGCAHLPEPGFRLHYGDKVKLTNKYDPKNTFFDFSNAVGTVADYRDDKTRCYPEVIYKINFKISNGETHFDEFCAKELILQKD